MTTSGVLVALLAAGLASAITFAVITVRSRRRPETPAQIEVETELDRIHGVLDALPTGLVIAGEDGEVVLRNAAARTVAGTHSGVLIDETIERHLSAAVDHTQSEELLDLYGPPKMVVVVRAAALPGGGAYAVVEDITERRRIDAVRTDFVANISHELKTPVGALAVLAETLVDESDPAVVERLSVRLLAEAHRAARTIDDLLELSRIELGGDTVVEDVGVDVVVREALERAEPLARQRSIEITRLEPIGDVPDQVHGDRRQLVSAVGNLVENAVKYSEDGGVVQIRTRRTGPWIEFLVIDQGVGIPARDLDRIFERFYRVDKARSRGTGGSGLGLSIVRHVATNHGGEVLVSSREGEGSTFVLRVPVAQRSVVAPVDDVDDVAAGELPADPPSDASATSTSSRPSPDPRTQEQHLR